MGKGVSSEERELVTTSEGGGVVFLREATPNPHAKDPETMNVIFALLGDLKIWNN